LSFGTIWKHVYSRIGNTPTLLKTEEKKRKKKEKTEEKKRKKREST
tara:strand:+ start:63 stop:200 length:138 start_codon:yes stop_codon:yes gene_type:complete